VVPVALICDKLHAVVVGAGNVGTRKARTLIDGGARVTVISVTASDEMSELARNNDRVSLMLRPYAGKSDLASCDIVIAATESLETNLAVASDASELHRLVSIVNSPLDGSFTSMAIHRHENLTIGVTAGRAPREAIRVRDAIAEHFAEIAGEAR
jgi:siroheme synthase-like protein